MVSFPENDEFTIEERDASPSHLLIKIESFSLLSKHWVQQYESREFAAGDYKWKLIIHLNGDYISVDLAVAGTDSLPMNWEVNAIFGIFLYNQISDNYLCFRGKVRRFHAMKSKWGLSKFISKKDLNDPCNGFVVDEKCVFGAEVFVIKSQRAIECVSVLKSKYWKFSNFFKLKGVWGLEHKKRTSRKVLPRTMALLPPDHNVNFNFGGFKKENEKIEAEFTMEIRDASPSHLLIKIESSSIRWEHGIQKYESGEFAAGGYKWRLIIYPNGDYISADLAMAGTSSLPVNWEVNAIFSIFLYNQISDNYLCFRGKMRRFHGIKSEWGLSKFISKKSLTDPSNGYLVNDNCVFGAEVFVIKSKQAIERVSVLKVTDPYKRDWKISNFSKLERVWTSEEFTAGNQQWKIWLYPNGRGSEIGRSVSIFLESVDSKGCAPHEKLKAKFCLRIKNQLYDKHRSMEYSSWFISSGNALGWHAFIPIGDMRDTSKGFIVDDCCLLETKISMQVVVARDPP